MTDRADRELSNALEDHHDWAAMPAGGSGSGTPRPRPDVLALRDGTAVAIEVKRRTSDWPQSVHLTTAEVEALRDFAARAGARPWLAIRPHRGRSRQDWHLYSLGALHPTDGGYSVRQRDLPGATLAEVVGDA